MIDVNLNTKELSLKSGVSRATTCSVKNGKSCNYNTALKLSIALGVSLEKLIER